ncbi:MAG TPA: endonuclease/exonuclease/phosphatase family protein [Candidatus Limnocylindria bacterium]|nr:endonuclease/exonuclease/phosphatase family protein [Candidatus Limnocylindria bacterium]
MQRALAALTVAAALAPSWGAAADRMVGGKLLRLVAPAGSPDSRALTFRAVPDPLIAAPFGDPTAGASLFVFSSNQTGGCRLDVSLPAANWSPLGGNPADGWKYVDPTASVGGVRKIVVKPGARGGKLTVKAKGSALPCDVAAAQNTPVEVTLRMGDERYCASFGGTIARNEPGKFKAKGSPAPLACAGSDARIVTLNVLHGIFCPGGTGSCRLADRIALLAEWIRHRNCPDVVALQEVSSGAPGIDVLTQVNAQLVDACPDPYHVAFQQTFAADDSLILSRYAVVSNVSFDLYGPARYAQHARLDHPIGLLDVFSTHLASGSDGANNPCGSFETCPTECVTAGAATVRECQAVQLANYVASAHDVDPPAFIVGDFNAQPGSFVYDQYVVGLGAVDTFLAAGNAECVPATGAGCTSGRIDDALTDLESTDPNVTTRIDYAFMVPPAGSSTCGTLDSPADADGDGVGTRLFAAEPNPFAACGPAPAPPCFVSDHNGVEADVNCS